MAQNHTDLPQDSLPSKEGGGTSVLPADGKLIHVSAWRQQVSWFTFAWFALLNLSLAVVAFSLGSLGGVGLGLAALATAVISVRATMMGLILEQQGVKVRTPVWTYRWRWNEIEQFELRPRGHIPRLRLRLHDGRVKKVRGFFARRPEEEERAQALVNALEERLKSEQEK